VADETPPDPRDARIAELEELVRKQAKRIAELERIIEEWTRGHRARPKRRSTRQAAENRKKPGRKKGHPGAFRKNPGKADRQEDHLQDRCEDCAGHRLKETGASLERKVEEVVPARKEVVGHVTYEYECRDCGKVQWSKLPPEYGSQPVLGPTVLAMIANLRYEVRLSIHQVAWYMTKVVGLPITAGGISQMLARAAERTAPVFTEIQAAARNAPFNHMDETSWFESGVQHWAWIVSSPEYSLFHVDKSRGHEVIEKLLCVLDDIGQVVVPYGGFVVSDFMGAYRTCQWMLHQYCWAHLICAAKKEAELDPNWRTKEFRHRVAAIHRDALVAQATEDAGDKHGIRVRLGSLAADPRLRRHPDVARLQDRINTEFHNLLTFLDAPGLPADNNRGERDLRPLVIFRATSFGTRSPLGTATHAHWMSVTQTARKQGVPLGPFLTKALAAHHADRRFPHLIIN
jgi:SAM-dependent methyltransferase